MHTQHTHTKTPALKKICEKLIWVKGSVRGAARHDRSFSEITAKVTQKLKLYFKRDRQIE